MSFPFYTIVFRIRITMMYKICTTGNAVYLFNFIYKYTTICDYYIQNVPT